MAIPNVFLDNYNKGIIQYLNNVSGSFFTQIDFDKSVIKNKASEESGLMSKILQIDAQGKLGTDNFTKLKFTGRILLDIAPNIILNADADIKRSGVNIINSFFDIAKQTGDEELLKTAAAISGTVKTIQSKAVNV